MKNRQFFVQTLMALALCVSTTLSAQQMDPNMAGMHKATATEAHGTGVVKAIDTAKGTITLQHQAIPSIGWPAMTMAFKANPPGLLQKVKVGDTVRFTLHPAGMASTVTAISPLP
ncbi:copper-binding protein [Oleiagrimonas sp. C23AA]|uniref:copper-binding protein n=1 Tax=Oleiagrimonas sp. C23AA TaxID=2719047 RepID=UPI0031B6C9C0